MRDRILFAIHALLAAALIAELFQACAPNKPPLAACSVGAFDAPCSPRLERSVEISDRFNAEEREDVINGAALWEVASGGAVRFNIVERHRSGGFNPITIERGPVVGDFVGVTRNGSHITVDADKIAPDVGLAGVVAHELGHAMGVDHSTFDDDLMAPSVHACMRITPRDLAALQRSLERQGR